MPLRHTDPVSYLLINGMFVPVKPGPGPKFDYVRPPGLGDGRAVRLSRRKFRRPQIAAWQVIEMMRSQNQSVIDVSNDPASSPARSGVLRRIRELQEKEREQVSKATESRSPARTRTFVRPTRGPRQTS